MRGLSLSLGSKRVTVLGAGKSGTSALRLLSRLGCKILLSEKSKLAPKKRDFLEKKGIEIEEGMHSSRILQSELIVVSPGVNWNLPILERARNSSIPVIGELELGYRFINGRVVAITGTNGKSTVASIIHKILRGRGAFLTGNIGVPLSSLAWREGLFVIEASSFQLRSTVLFRPDVAIILNIHEDHLDWHRNFEEYVESKKRIFANQRGGDFLIINYDEPLLKEIARDSKGKKIYFSLTQEVEGCYLKGRDIILNLRKKEKVIDVEELPYRGTHMIQNYLASLLGAFLLGATLDEIRRGIFSFKGLPYRLSKRECNGIPIYNDSKSTNPHSVLSAISSLEGKIILIMGGKEKGLDYSKLLPFMRGKVKMIILIGETKERLYNLFSPYMTAKKADSLEEAVEEALNSAKKGDSILFSPGTSSFDMFKNYIDRGEKFDAILEKRKHR